jgi:hypothetical protein
MIEIGDIIKWGNWNATYGLVINKTVDIVTIKWFKDGSQGSHGINSSLVKDYFVVISK